MVIVNEYHHVAAFSFEKARKVAKVKYPAVGTLTVTWVLPRRTANTPWWH